MKKLLMLLLLLSGCDTTRPTDTIPRASLPPTTPIIREDPAPSVTPGNSTTVIITHPTPLPPPDEPEPTIVTSPLMQEGGSTTPPAAIMRQPAPAPQVDLGHKRLIRGRSLTDAQWADYVKNSTNGVKPMK